MLFEAKQNTTKKRNVHNRKKREQNGNSHFAVVYWIVYKLAHFIVLQQ